MMLFTETALWTVAMGITLIHSIWIGLLILGVLRIVLLRIPVRLSRFRYTASVSALLLLTLSVLVVFLIHYEPAASGEISYASKSGSSFLKLLNNDTNGDAGIELSLLFSVFTYIYMAGVLFMLLRSAASLSYLRELRKNSSTVAPEWQQRFVAIGRSLGIKRRVDLVESTRVAGPLLAGILKPMVIVPAGMFTNLPLEQIESILIHELYHLKRWDHLVNIMQLIVESLLFYNPAVWIISGHIRKEREHCCDDGVVQETENPLIYARALIQIAEQNNFSRLVPGATGTGKKHFSSRIKRLLNNSTMKTTIRDRIISFAFLAGGLVLLLTVSGFSSGPSIIRFNNMSRDLPVPQMEEAKIAIPDTIPLRNEISEREDAAQDALEEIEEIEWEEIRQEIEDATEDALEEIEEIEWEELKIDMDSIRIEIEGIEWEEIKRDMQQSMLEMKLDMEEMRIEIENSMSEINWDEMRKDIEESMDFIDSIKIELNR